MALTFTNLPLSGFSISQPGLSNMAYAPVSDNIDTTVQVTGTFMENIGQVDNSEILFYAWSGDVAFTADSVMLYSINYETDSSSAMSKLMMQDVPPNISAGYALRLSFPGSNRVMPEGRGIANWHSNYFLGNDPEMWRTGIVNYHEIVYQNIWDGIDLVYHMGKDGVKYDFVIHPGADYRMINIKVEGQESLSISGGDALHMVTSLGPGAHITDSGLDVFYADGPDTKLNARFILKSADVYAFDIENPDKARGMIIDPLISSTFAGGAGTDIGMDIAVDREGCVYVTGYTNSIGFPTTPGAFEMDYNGHDSYDAFVMKLNPSGNSIMYSTFLGAVSNDYGSSVAVDSFGNAYVIGYTSSFSFPTTQGAFDTTYNGDTYDVFIAKLSSLGDTLVYSTLLGGTRSETGRGIAVDAYGYAYVTGNTWSYDFPITPDAYNRAFNGGLLGRNDAFVTKISPAGNSLVYSTFLGSSDYDYCNDIAIDGSGFAFVTGYTRSIGFPTTPGVIDRSLSGGIDAFVTKLSKSGTSVIYSTFLGGSGGESGQCIAVSKYGDAYVSGYTNSEDFPISSNAFDSTYDDWEDAFVARLSPYGDSLIYSTYLGGTGNDHGESIVIDNSGYAYITGSTASDDFPTTANAFDTSYNGNLDAFIAKLEPSGTGLMYSTFLGGNGTDSGQGIALAVTGYAFVTGNTDSATFPTTVGAPNTNINGDKDVFVTMLDLTPPVADAGPDQFINGGNLAIFNGMGSTDNHGIVNYTWSFNDGFEDIELYTAYAVHVFNLSGFYSITLNVSDDTANWATDQMTLTVLDVAPPVADAGPDQVVDEDLPVIFNGTGSTDNVGIANYTWTFLHSSESVSLYGVSPEFTFSVPGIYNVTLNVFDIAGNTDTDSTVITVNDITWPVVDAGQNISILKDTQVMLDASGSHDNVGIVDYTWTFNDGLGDVMLHGVSQFHTFSIEGVYVISLEASDKAGHIGTDSMTITVLEVVRPIANAGLDRTVNETFPMRFDGSISTDNVGVTRWTWTFNDGVNDVTLYGVSPSWVFTVPGIYDVTLNASDAAGNWNTDMMSVSVLDITDPIPVPGPNTVVMPGEVVTLDGASSTDRYGIINHTWSFTYNGTAISLYGPHQEIQLWTPGSYTVTLTVVDSAGNAASDTIVVTVLAPTAIVANGSDIPWPFIMMLVMSVVLISLAILVKRRGVGKS